MHLYLLKMLQNLFIISMYFPSVDKECHVTCQRMLQPSATEATPNGAS